MLGLFSRRIQISLSKVGAVTAYSTCSSTKVAVVLSGCGVFDGTEVHEAASVLSHLTRNGAIPQCFAPDIPQAHVVNHLEGKEEDPAKSCRNVLVESARIARGNVMPLQKLIEEQCSYDAVVFPGGFGVAKNLSDFAVNGVFCTVNPEVAKILTEFHCKRKPIGLACIAPILAARVLCNVTITLGKNNSEKWPFRDAIRQAKLMGAQVEDRDWNEVSFDRSNMIFSTPAYMYDGKFHEIDDGIGKMILYMLNVLRLGEKGQDCPPCDCPPLPGSKSKDKKACENKGDKKK